MLALVSPVQAIFMIPNSPPPTLPDPSHWSDDFNDFLRCCLQKNPEQRPSAADLLRTVWLSRARRLGLCFVLTRAVQHPFILNAPKKSIVAALVDECMPAIDEYRENETKEAEESSQQQQQAPPIGADGGQTMVLGVVAHRALGALTQRCADWPWWRHRHYGRSSRRHGNDGLQQRCLF